MTNEDSLHWLERVADVLHENASYLTQLDSSIGDADHGANMDRGFKAVRDKFPGMASMDISTQLKTVGMTLVALWAVRVALYMAQLFCVQVPLREGNRT